MITTEASNGITTYMDVDEATREALTVHWRAVFAGVFTAMLVYFILMSLGLAVGSGEIKDVFAGQDSAQSLGTGAGLWLLITVLISLFAGSYAASRVSGVIATRIGYVQGVVVSALFFTLMVTQAGVVLGALSSGFGAVKDMVSGTAAQAANSPRLTGIAEDALGDLDLKSPPETVSAGILSRLMRGDTDSAINYLSYQSGLTREEAQQRFDNLSNKVKATATDMANRSADAARATGWMAFALMLLGSVSAMLGGAVGAQLNLRKPLGKMDRRALRTQPA